MNNKVVFQTVWVCRPRCAVGNVSDYRSRGRKFDPGPILYSRGNWSLNHFCGHSLPFPWFKKGCCQLQVKECHKVLANRFVKPAQGKSVVRWTDRPDMTIAVDWDIKHQTKNIHATNFLMTWNILQLPGPASGTPVSSPCLGPSWWEHPADGTTVSQSGLLQAGNGR